jgi:hypothetical protein
VLQVRTHAQKHFLKLAKEEGLDAATSLYRGSYGWSEQKLNVSHGLALHKGDATDDADESSGAVDRAADGAGGGRAKKPRARRPRKPRTNSSGAVFSSAAASAGGKKRPSLGAGGGAPRSSAVAAAVSFDDPASDGPAARGAAAAADPGSRRSGGAAAAAAPGSQPRRSGRARRPNPRIGHGADDEGEGASAAAGPGRRAKTRLDGEAGEAWDGAGDDCDAEAGQQAYESGHGQGAGSARALSEGGALLDRRYMYSGDAAADSSADEGEGQGQGGTGAMEQRHACASSPPRQRRRLDSTGSSAAVAALVDSRGSALADYGFEEEEGGSEEGGAAAAEGDVDGWAEAGEGEYARGNGTHRTRVDAGERRRSDTESSSEAARRPVEAGDEAAAEAPGLLAARRTSRQRQGNSARPRHRGAANGRRARLASTVSATSAASLAPTVSDPHEAPMPGLPQEEADEDEEAEAETERSAFGGLSAAVSPDAAATIASILLDWRGRPTRSVSCGSSTTVAPLTAAAAASDDSRERDTAGAPVAGKGPSPTDSSRSSLSATHGGTRSGGSSAFAAFSGPTGPVEVPPAPLPQQALTLPAPSLPHHHKFSGALAASSLPFDWTAPGAGSLRQHQQRLQQHASAAPSAAGLPGEGPAAGFAAAAAAYRSLAPHSVLLANYSAPAPAAAVGAASLALPLRSPVPGAGGAGMHGVGSAAGGSVGTAFSNPGAPGSRVGSPASSHSPSPSAAASSGLLLESMSGGAGSSGAGGGAAAMPALPSFGFGGHLPPHPHSHHHAYPLSIVGGPFPLLHLRAAGPPGSLLHPHRQRHPSVHSRHEGDSDEEEAGRGRPAVTAAAGVSAPRAAAGCVAPSAVSAAVPELGVGVGMGRPGHTHHSHTHHDVLGTSPLPPSSQALGGPGGSADGLGPGPGERDRERGASAGPLSAGGGFGVSLHASPPHPHAPASASGRLTHCDGGASGGSSGSGGLPAAFGLSTSPAAPAELQGVPMAPSSSGGTAASIAGPFPPSAAALQLHAMTAGRHSPHDMHLQLLVPARGPGAGLEAGAPHLLPHAHTTMQPHSALQHSQFPAHYPLGAGAPASATLGGSLGAAAGKGALLPDPSPTTASAAAAVLLLKR